MYCKIISSKAAVSATCGQGRRWVNQGRLGEGEHTRVEEPFSNLFTSDLRSPHLSAECLSGSASHFFRRFLMTLPSGKSCRSASYPSSDAKQFWSVKIKEEKRVARGSSAVCRLGGSTPGLFFVALNRTCTLFPISFPPLITSNHPTIAFLPSSLSSIASLSPIHRCIPRRPEYTHSKCLKPNCSVSASCKTRTAAEIKVQQRRQMDADEQHVRTES